MRRREKIFYFFSVCILIIILVFLPILNGSFTENDFFKNEYYTLISAVIGGIITLYSVNVQIGREREKAHEEKVVGARCFFKVNYLRASDKDKKLELYKCRTNSIENDASANFYVILQLKNVSYVYDCKINIAIGEEIVNTNLGVVVTEQCIAIPIWIRDIRKIKFEIQYITQMNEKIVHELFFENIIDYKATERVYYYKNNKKERLLECESQIFKWENTND